MSEERVVPIGGKAVGRCPLCGKPSSAAFRPFCSKRCKDRDLHRWFTESYRVPTDEAPAEEPDAPARTRADEDGVP